MRQRWAFAPSMRAGRQTPGSTPASLRIQRENKISRWVFCSLGCEKVFVREVKTYRRWRSPAPVRRWTRCGIISATLKLSNRVRPTSPINYITTALFPSAAGKQRKSWAPPSPVGPSRRRAPRIPARAGLRFRPLPCKVDSWSYLLHACT